MKILGSKVPKRESICKGPETEKSFGSSISVFGGVDASKEMTRRLKRWMVLDQVKNFYRKGTKKVLMTLFSRIGPL